MDEKKQLEILERLYKDETIHPLLLTMWDVWQFFELCTLTLTHPNLPDYSRQYYTEMGHQLETFVLEEFPDLKELATACWNRGANSPINPAMRARLTRRYR